MTTPGKWSSQPEETRAFVLFMMRALDAKLDDAKALEGSGIQPEEVEPFRAAWRAAIAYLGIGDVR